MWQMAAAVESAWPKDNGLEKAARAKATSPTQWYVADDEAKSTRYFVIQGSETLDHWRVNVTFDPVPFEDPELGVSVHRSGPLHYYFALLSGMILHCSAICHLDMLHIGVGAEHFGMQGPGPEYNS